MTSFQSQWRRAWSSMLWPLAFGLIFLVSGCYRETITVSQLNDGSGGGSGSGSNQQQQQQEPFRIQSIVPNVGDMNGGETITITANWLYTGITPDVMIGGRECSNVIQIGQTQVTCQTPARLGNDSVLVIVQFQLNGGEVVTDIVNGGFSYDGTPRYQLLYDELFMNRCGGCHGASAGFDVSIYNDFLSASTQSPMRNRVTPGDSSQAASYLIEKLETAMPESGNQMPPGGPYFSTTEMTFIKSWIDAGALE